MSDRLKELQRQRALVEEQLTWLDREIARETGGQPAIPAGRAAPQAGVTSARPATQPAEPSADKILAQYQTKGHPVQDEIKRGCLMYFFGALAFLVLLVAAVYFLRYRH